MNLNKSKIGKVIASMEQANFTDESVDGNITVSQEGISDIFSGIGQAWTNWRLARINKRPRLSQKDLEKINTWGYSVSRQINKTYGEKRWVGQKMDENVADIPFAEFSTLMTLAGTGKVATFTQIFEAMVESTDTTFKMFEHIEKYIGMLSKEISDSWTAQRAYDELTKTIALIGTPRQLIEKHLDTMPLLPGNKVILIESAAGASMFTLADSKKPAAVLETLEIMSENDFPGFSRQVIRVLNALTDNNYFKEEFFFEREMFAEIFYYAHSGAVYSERGNETIYEGVLKLAYRNRNTDVIEALSPDFWNLAVSDLIVSMSALNLDVMKAGVAYMNRHLK